MSKTSSSLVSRVSLVSRKKYYAPHVRTRVEHNSNLLTHATHVTQTDELEAIAQQEVRLLPDRRDPEAFHVAKSEVVGRLRGLIRRIRLGNAERGEGKQRNSKGHRNRTSLMRRFFRQT